MFESPITIQGGPFSVPTTYNDILSKRMNLVFGRNGSGKSSIARAFREQQAGREQKDYQLSFDGSGSFPDAVRNHLFVFNEDFIDENVKIKDSGLRSIVRIGNSAQLDEPINAAKAAIDELKKERDPLAGEYGVLVGSKAGSVAEAEKQLKDRLKAPDGFLDRFSRLEGKKCNLTATLLSSVSGTTVKSHGDFSIANATAELNAGIDRYLTLQDGVPVYWQAPDLSVMPDLDAVNEMLTRSVRSAELTEQDRMILEDLSNALASEDMLSKTQKLIIDEERTYCPLCHQAVSPGHRHELAQRLQRFRDRVVEDFKAQIDSVLGGMRTIDESLPALPASQYQADLDRGSKAIAELNACISGIRDAMLQKQSSPWVTQPAFPKSDLDARVSACREAIDRLGADVTFYNKSMLEKQMLLDQLKTDNATLAVHEALDLILELNRRTERRDELSRKIGQIDATIGMHQDIITQLQGKLDQTDDAREQINNYLDIIFGQKRLRLVNAGKDNYRLQLRRGESYVDIPPRAVSSGERNALALAYFFACVMDRKVSDYKYDEPTLLVIDDPVSSFDAENRAGVISLLGRQCKKVLQGDKESKVLIFTHDRPTLRELCARRSEFFKDDNAQTDYYLWLNSARKLFRRSSGIILENMEYDSELNTVFRFANLREPAEFDEYDTMGNTIRRFAESYANRMFKCPWTALFADDSHLECLPEAIRDKISSFAIRPVLNSNSHGIEMDYEAPELQRAARILLIYMFYASHDHLQAFLVGTKADYAWKMDNVEAWARDL